MIRPADPDRDAAAVAAIYAPYVRETPATFDVSPPSAAEMAEKIAALRRSHAFLVLERDGAVAGYAYAGPHHERAAYRWAVNVSVYVHPDHHRTGVGRALYGALFDELRARGFRSAIAGITLPNPGSVGLHESFGFELVGVYRAIGWKAGAWRDVSWWQLPLRPPGEDGSLEDPPPEPLPADARG